MYTNLYVYKAPSIYMSGKLYHRIKKDGKWTWTPCDSWPYPQKSCKHCDTYHEDSMNFTYPAVEVS